MPKFKYGNPTYGVTFKMLLGNENNTQVLLSFVNSLLNFRGRDLVEKLKFLSKEYLTESSQEEVMCSDLLCTTIKGDEILIQVQLYNKALCLPETQVYLSKFLCKTIESRTFGRFDEFLPKTYAIVIATGDILDDQLNDDELYELTVTPKLLESTEHVPTNKMAWKYFNLTLFAKKLADGRINKLFDEKLPLKEQWLNFLANCSNTTNIPADADSIIQDAYKIMEKAKWSQEFRANYKKSLRSRMSQHLSITELKIKSELKLIKVLFKHKIQREEIISELNFLVHGNVIDSIEENLSYIQNHINDSDSDICENLDLVDDLLGFV